MKDEQTDDLQGFPKDITPDFDQRSRAGLPVYNIQPPCTGYEGDYEENERLERAGRW